MYRKIFKRAFDLTISTCSIVALSSVMLSVAIAIKLEDGGPVIFKQKRIGKYGKFFFIYKFRSMRVNTGDMPSAQANNTQITKIGKFIRRTNIDELPQLFNIFLGEMSVVGPRPALPIQEDLNSMRMKNGAFSCIPGLTGLAQVNSYTGMSETEKANWDGVYARSITFGKDVWIIVRTFGYLMSSPPVY